MTFRLAYHAITWGPEPNVAGMLSEIRQAGYEGLELFQDEEALGPAKRLKSMLAEVGLIPVALTGVAHIIGPEAANAVQATKERIDYAAALGARYYVVVPPFLQREQVEADHIREFAANLDLLSNYARPHNLEPTVHHHMKTLIETADDCARLIELSPESLLTFDSAHCAVAGDDCAHMLRRFSRYIDYVHLKDYNAPLPAGSDWDSADFAELGRGTGAIDFAAILQELGAIGYEGWLTVELDGKAAKRPPYQSAQISREYLRQLVNY